MKLEIYEIRAPYLEDHPSGCKWLGSPPIYKTFILAIWKGSRSPILGGLTITTWLLTTYLPWDDPPSSYQSNKIPCHVTHRWVNAIPVESRNAVCGRRPLATGVSAFRPAQQLFLAGAGRCGPETSANSNGWLSVEWRKGWQNYSVISIKKVPKIFGVFFGVWKRWSTLQHCRQAPSTTRRGKWAKLWTVEKATAT